MRSSPRLSLFAACCTAAMMTFVLEARTYTYTLTSESNAPGWTHDENGSSASGFKSNGYCFGAGNVLLTSPTFSDAITNITFSGSRSSSCTRTIQFTPGLLSAETWSTDPLVTSTDTSKPTVFKIAEYSVSDNVLSFSLKCTGGAKNFYLKYVTVYIADPPPTIATIIDQQASTASDLVVHFTAT